VELNADHFFPHRRIGRAMVTLKDVAKAAGVNINTVSATLSGSAQEC